MNKIEEKIFDSIYVDKITGRLYKVVKMDYRFNQIRLIRYRSNQNINKHAYKKLKSLSISIKRFKEGFRLSTNSILKQL